MLFGQVTTREMQAGQLLTGATMAAFLAAPLFRRHAGRLRVAITVFYILGIIAFAVYAWLSPAPG